MEAFANFLANHYMWFLVFALLFLFSLIGYFVDQSEQKKGISKFSKSEEEYDLQSLASMAQNKTIGSAIQDGRVASNMANNVILDTDNNIVNQNDAIEILSK